MSYRLCFLSVFLCCNIPSKRTEDFFSPYFSSSNMCLVYSKHPLEVFAVQLLSHVWLFLIPWTVASQNSMSFTVSWSMLRLTSTESVVPSNHLTFCQLLLLPSVFLSAGSFPMSWLFTSGGQSIGASASILPMNIQGWFPLRLTGLTSLYS